jgi:peptide/nickel transport system substrate-binding protein
MNKISLLVILLGCSLILTTTPIAFAQVPDPNVLITASIGDPSTLDPAKCYDQASGILLFNVYETLVFWDEDSITEFAGFLAEDWTISTDGKTYTFTIREGVPWHDPAYGTVTPEDVEYSIERVMVTDQAGGPQWMLFEPLLGCQAADLDDPDFMTKIDNSVTVDGNTVTFNLYMPYPPLLHILSNCYGGSILCKQWCIDNGDWDGVHTMESLIQYHDPELPWQDTLDHSAPGPHLDAMMGTGPYIFDYWEHGVEWSVVKFDDYWRGWPNPETTYLGHPRRGYVERYTYKRIEEWAARRDAFLVGDYDNIYIPTTYIGQVEGEPGIECLYPYPGLGTTCMFFNYNVSLASPHLTPLGGLPYGTLDELGAPPDIFSDIHLRKAFAQCVDYDVLINDVLLGEAVRPTSPLCGGLAPDFRNPDQPVYNLNLEAAEAEFMLAWDGELWETGFTLVVSFNSGNEPRQTITTMLETNIEAMNPKFHIEVLAVDWGSTYIPMLFTNQLTMFIIGWGADYPDAHNFMYTFMGEYGTFSYFQAIDYPDTVGNATLTGLPYVEARLMEGIAEVDENKRQEIYNELQEIYYESCASVTTWDPTVRRWQREWVQGWYNNPIYPGTYAYAIWKEDLPRVDMNEDGAVNILDIARCAVAFGAYFEPGFTHPRWDPYADVNFDREVNILDIAAIASNFGIVLPPWTPA